MLSIICSHAQRVFFDKKVTIIRKIALAPKIRIFFIFKYYIQYEYQSIALNEFILKV